MRQARGRWDVTIPMDLPSRSNLDGSRHWRRRARRVRLQVETVSLVLQTQPRPTPPVTARLTRISPRSLDDDNLRGSLKAVRDAVASWLGIDDGGDAVRWLYAQRRDPEGRPRFTAAQIEIWDAQYDCPTCGQATIPGADT